MKILAYSMPILFVIWGSLSEHFGITFPPYYATIGYIMGMVSIILIYESERKKEWK